MNKPIFWIKLRYVKKLCGHTLFFFKKSLRKTCKLQNFYIPLHRDPENNLFTLRN